MSSVKSAPATLVCIVSFHQCYYYNFFSSSFSDSAFSSSPSPSSHTHPALFIIVLYSTIKKHIFPLLLLPLIQKSHFILLSSHFSLPVNLISSQSPLDVVCCSHYLLSVFDCMFPSLSFSLSLSSSHSSLSLSLVFPVSLPTDVAVWFLSFHNSLNCTHPIFKKNLPLFLCCLLLCVTFSFTRAPSQ